MKTIISILLTLTLVATLAWAGGRREGTPKVRYIEPKREAVVDLSNKEVLTFKWKSTPIPGGGRMAYRFEIFSGFGYEQIMDETLVERVFEIEVPAKLFKDGVLYTWQVKQRDAHTRIWSMDQRWSFTVKQQ